MKTYAKNLTRFFLFSLFMGSFLVSHSALAHTSNNYHHSSNPVHSVAYYPINPPGYGFSGYSPYVNNNLNPGYNTYINPYNNGYMAPYNNNSIGYSNSYNSNYGMPSYSHSSYYNVGGLYGSNSLSYQPGGGYYNQSYYPAANGYSSFPPYVPGLVNYYNNPYLFP